MLLVDINGGCSTGGHESLELVCCFTMRLNLSDLTVLDPIKSKDKIENIYFTENNITIKNGTLEVNLTDRL